MGALVVIPLQVTDTSRWDSTKDKGNPPGTAACDGEVSEDGDRIIGFHVLHVGAGFTACIGGNLDWIRGHRVCQSAGLYREREII